MCHRITGSRHSLPWSSLAAMPAAIAVRYVASGLRFCLLPSFANQFRVNMIISTAVAPRNQRSEYCSIARDTECPVDTVAMVVASRHPSDIAVSARRGTHCRQSGQCTVANRECGVALMCSQSVRCTLQRTSALMRTSSAARWRSTWLKTVSGARRLKYRCRRPVFCAVSRAGPFA